MMSKLVVDGCQCQRCVKAENARLRKTAEMVGPMEDFMTKVYEMEVLPGSLHWELDNILADIQKAKETAAEGEADTT